MLTTVPAPGPAPDPETLWTVHDVARFLKMSESWVNKRAARDEIPALRIGRALRFDPSEIRAWVKAYSATLAAGAPDVTLEDGDAAPQPDDSRPIVFTRSKGR